MLALGPWQHCRPACTLPARSRKVDISSALCAGGLAPPLYIHSTTQGGIQGRLREGSPETEWEQRVTQLFRSQARPSIPSSWPRPLMLPPQICSIDLSEQLHGHIARVCGFI